MNLRLGDLIFTPSLCVLPFAVAFFLVISWRRLFPAVIATRNHALGVLSVSCIGGIAGAWFYGLFVGPSWAVADTDRVWIPLGSFGGYWGALITAIFVGLAARQKTFRYADALVPGILVGGAVARIGCAYTGCCPGIVILWQTLGPLQPFRPWPLYDLAALLLTSAVSERIVRRRAEWAFDGARVCLFCLIYGSLRFFIEFVRITPHAFGSVTWGHIAAAVQITAGLLLLARQRALPVERS